MESNDEPPLRSLADLMAALDRGQADVAAGRIVPGETVIAELDLRIAEMEGQQTDKATHVA